MPKCKDCIHFLICANLFGEVQADTEINNIDGKQCYYFLDKCNPNIDLSKKSYLHIKRRVENSQKVMDI